MITGMQLLKCLQNNLKDSKMQMSHLFSDHYMKLKEMPILMVVEPGFGGEKPVLKLMLKSGNIFMKN